MIRTALLALLAGCRPTPAPDTCPGCDVVWITVDSLRYDRVGPHDGKASLTPAVDALAARGTTFRTAIAQGPNPVVSVPSYLSSRYLHETGMTFDLAPRKQYRSLPESIITLAEVLQGAGYETQGYVANPMIAGTTTRFDIEQGFDTWKSDSDPQVTRDGLAALDLPRENGKPLFLYLHYLGPHLDNLEREGFEERRGQFDTPIRDKVGATGRLYSRIVAGQVEVDPAGWEWIRALYDDSVAETDELVGRVLDAVKNRSRPTLVVFTSDHGESLGDVHDHVYVGHNQALWEEVIHVPLVIAGPGVAEHVVQKTGIAELIDVAPTLTNLLGMKSQAVWGWSGSPLLGPGGAMGSVAIATSRTGNDIHGIVRDEHTKVLMQRVGQDGQRFDLAADPLEQTPTTIDVQTDALGQVLHQSWVDARPVENLMFTPSDEAVEQADAIGYTQ